MVEFFVTRLRAPRRPTQWYVVNELLTRAKADNRVTLGGWGPFRTQIAAEQFAQQRRHALRYPGA